MSPQPSQVHKFPPEVSGAGDDLVFGQDPRGSLAIPKALIAQLWAQVHEGTRSLARGGLEVGGLLVGPKIQGDRVVVEGIIPLPIEYRHGPSFHMSPTDLDSIAPAVETVQGDRSKAVVGFYRSRTRGEGMLRGTDHEILDAIERVHNSFAVDFRCCFILAPKSESAALACIVMRNEGGWDEVGPFTLRLNPLSIVSVASPAALQQVPRDMHAQELATYEPGSGAVAHSEAEVTHQHQDGERHAWPLAAPLSVTFAGRSAAPPATVRRSPPRRRIAMYVCGAAVAVAIAAGTYRWAILKQPQAPNVRAEVEAPRPHLGFSATREGPVWKLSWDRAAMDALNPLGAVLSIVDGGLQQDVPLMPADLASGTIFYTPQSNDLTFGLRIDRGATQVEEHVRVLGAPGIAQKPADRAPQPAPGTPPVQPRADTKSVTPAPVNTSPRSTVPATKATTSPSTPSSTPSSAPLSAPLSAPSGTVASTPASRIQASSPSASAQPAATREPVARSTPDRDAAPAPQAPPVALAVPVPPPAESRASPDVAATPAPKPPVVALAVPVPPRTEPRANSDVVPAPAASGQPAITSPAAGAGSPPDADAPKPGTAAAAPTRAAAPVAALPDPPAAAPAPARVDYVGPRPIQQVSPRAPADLPSGASTVQVLVAIDARGRVTKVVPIGWTSANAALMVAAVRAASSWVFDPARLNGNPVASQMTLIFRF